MWAARALEFKRVRFLIFIFLAACVVNIKVDPKTRIACGDAKECPAELSLCHDGLCVAALPAPTLSFGSIVRTTGLVEVPLRANQGASITVEVSVDDGAFEPASFEERSVAEGEQLLHWNAAAALPLRTRYQANIRLRVTPEGGEPSVSEPFAFGNDVPVIGEVSLDLDAGDPVEGIVVVRFTVSDSSEDLVYVSSLTAEPFGIEAVADDLVAGAVSSLSTEDGPRTHSFAWDTTQALNVAATGVTFALRVGDAFGESEIVRTVPLAVRNQTPPVAVSVFTKRDDQLLNGVIPFVYSLSDDQEDVASVVVEYSTDDTHWFPCSEFNTLQSEGLTGLATSPDGVLHSFFWDAPSDLFSAVNAVTVRLTPRDAAVGELTELLFSAPIGPSLIAPNHTPFFTTVINTGMGPGGRANATAGDIDGDDSDDFVYSNDNLGTDATVIIGADTTLLGLGAVSGDRTALALADMGGDASLDIIVSHANLRTFFTAISDCSASPCTFAPGPTGAFAASGEVEAIRAADVDEDGFNDVITLSDVAMNVVLGDGASGFLAPVVYGISGPVTSSLLVADLTGDDHLDIVVGGNPLQIFEGSGDGSFSRRVISTQRAKRVALIDANRDGFDDLVFTSFSGVYLKLGPSLSSETALYSGIFFDLVVQDVNRDGLEDLIASNNSEWGLFLGYGDGTFDPPIKYTQGQVFEMVPFDEGFVSIDTQTQYAPNLKPVIGAGAFSAPTRVTNTGTLMTTGDFNADGVWDFALLGSEGIEVRLGNGLDGVSFGGFSAPTLYPLPVPGGTPHFRAMDLNADGATDLVLDHACQFQILYADGFSGNFFDVVTYDMGAPSCTPTLFAFGDFNGDTLLDAVGSHLTVALGITGPTSSYGTFKSRSLVPYDFDLDGALDVLSIRRDTTTGLIVAYGGGDGTFAPSSPSSLATGESEGLQLGDFNSDGLIDAAFWNSAEVVLYTGAANDTFVRGTPQPMQSVWPGYVSDFNGDGSLDAVSYDISGTPGLTFFERNLSLRLSLPVNGLLLTFGLADINSDGVTDVLASVGETTVSMAGRREALYDPWSLGNGFSMHRFRGFTAGLPGPVNERLNANDFAMAVREQTGEALVPVSDAWEVQGNAKLSRRADDRLLYSVGGAPVTIEIAVRDVPTVVYRRVLSYQVDAEGLLPQQGGQNLFLPQVLYAPVPFTLVGGKAQVQLDTGGVIQAFK